MNTHGHYFKQCQVVPFCLVIGSVIRKDNYTHVLPVKS